MLSKTISMGLSGIQGYLVSVQVDVSGGLPAFDIVLEKRFDWGEVQLHLTLKDGTISVCHVYSDAMDEQFIERIAPALQGVDFKSEAMYTRLLDLGDAKAESLAGWIKEKGF